MVKHIVMWKLADFAEGNSKAENALKMKAMLEGMPLKIESLEAVEVGIHMFEVKDDSVCDVVLTAMCVNEFELKAYAAHPEHQKVVEFIKKVVVERRVTDYLV